MPASFFTGYLAQGVGPFSAFVENTAAGYARVPVVFTPLNLGSAALSLGVTFPGSASYMVTQRALYDAPTGGNLILYWGLKNPVVVTGAGQDKINAGALNHFYPALSNNTGAGLNSTPVTSVANAVIGQTNTGLPVYAGTTVQVVNGTISYLPASTGGGGATTATMLRLTGSGSVNVAASPTEVSIRQSAAGNYVIASNSAGDGSRITVADALGNFGTYNATLTATGCTINGQPSYVMSVNNQSVTLTFDATNSNYEIN